jgi:hypothetical protein
MALVRYNHLHSITSADLHIEHVTEDPMARMHWKNYWRNVVKKYQVIVEGWPGNIPFASFSDVSTPLPDLETLLRQWQSGKIYWRELTTSEFKKLDKERDNQIESGEIDAPAPRRRRSDRGKKRSRSKYTVDNGDGSQKEPKRRKKRSRDVIDGDSDSESPDDSQRKRNQRKKRSCDVINTDEDDSGSERPDDRQRKQKKKHSRNAIDTDEDSSDSGRAS